MTAIVVSGQSRGNMGRIAGKITGIGSPGITINPTNGVRVDLYFKNVGTVTAEFFGEVRMHNSLYSFGLTGAASPVTLEPNEEVGRRYDFTPSRFSIPSWPPGTYNIRALLFITPLPGTEVDREDLLNEVVIAEPSRHIQSVVVTSL